jgi:SAM-dependent methyltransferase
MHWPESATKPSAQAQEALRSAMLGCLHDELGWSREKAEKHALREEQRRGAIGLLQRLNKRGWLLRRSTVLDVGAGFGSLLLELLQSGAEGFGIEPSLELCHVSALRLSEAGAAPNRIIKAIGEELPFRTASADYVISTQVLEHVRDPKPVLQEIYRVLKPGGKAYISCENYLAFKEQEYRVPWLPLLPKAVGARYLKLLGREPSFLLNHVHYTTYPQIWRLCAEVGFINETYGSRSAFMTAVAHASHLFRIGVRVHLAKPQ